MKSPELAEPIDSSSPETEETSVSESKELHEGGNIQKLWKKYHWMGEPPIAGTPVESRLRNICYRFLQYRLGKFKSADILNIKQPDPENYFAQFRKPTKNHSEVSQRELHNQIALMVTGKQRSGMEHEEAEKVTQFASEVAYNCSLEDALEKYGG